MSFREDTFHYFFVHEPSSNRGPFNRQWDYLACCRLEDRPRRARSPVQRPLRRARPEVWDGGFLYLACARNVVGRTLVIKVDS